MSATLFEEAGATKKGSKAGAEGATQFKATDLFRHTVVYYPLVEAIRDGIVKKPILERVEVRNKDTGEIRAHDMAAFERTVRVNLFGTFRVLSQSAAGMVTLEPMADGERGLIVNTASVAAQDGQIGQAAYSASKGGVYAMTLPIARDLAQEGVRCNTILPGIMWTPMMAGMDQKVQDSLAAAIPFPSRLGKPSDYASLVLELARNVYINGECIRLDGAIRLAPR